MKLSHSISFSSVSRLNHSNVRSIVFSGVPPKKPEFLDKFEKIENSTGHKIKPFWKQIPSILLAVGVIGSCAAIAPILLPAIVASGVTFLIGLVVMSMLSRYNDPPSPKHGLKMSPKQIVEAAKYENDLNSYKWREKFSIVKKFFD